MGAGFQGLSEGNSLGTAALAGLVPPAAIAILNWRVFEAAQRLGTLPSARGALAMTLAWVAADFLVLVCLAIGDQSPEMAVICGMGFLAFALPAFLLSRGGFWPPHSHPLTIVPHIAAHSRPPSPTPSAVSTSRSGSATQHGDLLANPTFWTAVGAMAAAVSAMAAVIAVVLQGRSANRR